MDKFEVIATDGKWTVNGKVFYTESASRAYVDSKTNPPPKGSGVPSKVVWQIVVGCILGYGAYSCTSPSKEKAGAIISESEALMLCQYAIKGALGNAAGVDVPYVASFGSGDEAYFAWGSSTKYVQAGPAAEVPASCTISKSKRKIAALTIGGQTII